jgi:hypothetical protein
MGTPGNQKQCEYFLIGSAVRSSMPVEQTYKRETLHHYLFGIHTRACNLSSLGLSNICAQSGHSMSVAFVDNTWVFFARKFSPFQGVANVESSS